MIELIDVRKIGNLKFKVSFKQNGKLKDEIITQEEHEVGKSGNVVAVIVAENPEFYDVWGQSLEFRKSVTKSIRLLREKNTPELQTA